MRRYGYSVAEVQYYVYGTHPRAPPACFGVRLHTTDSGLSRCDQIVTLTKLICWNIQQGGGSRIPRIVEEISAYDPDVIALTGFRTTPGVALCASLKERGWPNVETTHPIENQNGVAVFSRTPMRTRPCPAPPEDAVNWLNVD